MSTTVRDRVFGAPVSTEVRKIFNRLQRGVYDPDPNEPISDTLKYKDYLGDRTPFARMWTAVRIVGVNKEDRTKQRHQDSLYYVINDNAQDSYQPNKQIKGSKRKGQLVDGENPYMKPPAGITSISTKTEGALGVIKRTSVDFVVHNKEDFQNIVLPFFLRPGTTICLDFGWAIPGIGRELYSIEDLIKPASGKLEIKDTMMQHYYKKIYGVGQKGDANYIPGWIREEQNFGRVNTIVGEVQDFNSSVNFLFCLINVQRFS